LQTLGILKADIVDEPERTENGDFDEMFVKLFSEVPQFEHEFRVYELTLNKFPKCVHECDSYLITGSRFSVYDDEPWIHQLKNFVRRIHEAKIKLIGICFGHQIIADALGGIVLKSEKGWGLGAHEYKVVHPNPLSFNCANIQLLCSHQDQVVKVPDLAKVVLTSNFCENAGTMIDEYIVTIQGHPEFSKSFANSLCWSHKEELGEQFETAVESLTSTTDESLVAGLLVSFLNDGFLRTDNR